MDVPGFRDANVPPGPKWQSDIDGIVFAIFLTAKHTGADEDDPWHKFLCCEGRAMFQMDLVCVLIEAGMRMDCPNIEDLKGQEKKASTHEKGQVHSLLLWRMFLL